jgi:hypothetical protein
MPACRGCSAFRRAAAGVSQSAAAGSPVCHVFHKLWGSFGSHRAAAAAAGRSSRPQQQPLAPTSTVVLVPSYRPPHQSSVISRQQERPAPATCQQSGAPWYRSSLGTLYRCQRAASRHAPASSMPIERSATGAAEFGGQRADLDDLAKRRFFYRPAFDIYGGVGGFYTYGPPGCALKNNVCAQWRKHFIIEDNMMEIEDPAVTPHRVLNASGHVERFSDFMVRDLEDESKYYRADNLLEDHIEALLEKGGISDAEATEHKKVMAQADAYSQEELGQKLKEYGVKSADGHAIGEPYPFNLMFPTDIGPSGKESAFLRPETAQGIFVNFKFAVEQNKSKGGGGMPLGIAQIGKAYRNEIAPRGGLIRLREFSQAEIEYFVHPEKKAFAKFHRLVADLELLLHPYQQQLAAEPPVRMTLGEAVKKGIIANETLGYFVGRTAQFMLSVGIRKEHLRFRQHLPSEMAHYACGERATLLRRRARHLPATVAGADTHGASMMWLRLLGRRGGGVRGLDRNGGHRRPQLLRPGPARQARQCRPHRQVRAVGSGGRVGGCHCVRAVPMPPAPFITRVCPPLSVWVLIARSWTPPSRSRCSL